MQNRITRRSRRRGGTARLGLAAPPGGPSVEGLEARRLLTTFVVTSTADAGPGSLRDAVNQSNAAPGADLVTFAPDVLGTITLTSGQLVIDDSLTVQGPGADVLTVSGGGSSRVVQVFGGDDAASTQQVTISGLTIAGGRASDGAGVLVLPFSDVTLRDVVVSSNRAVGSSTSTPFGGGIRARGRGAAVTLVDSTVTGNFADGTVIGNRAAVGGGIEADLGAAVRLLHSSVTANQALGSRQFAEGGGITARTGASLLLSHTEVVGNRAVAGANRSADGGGISVVSSEATIDHSRFSANEAVGGERILFGGNGEGGGLSVLDSDVTVDDSAFSDNRAAGGASGGGAGGGAVFVGGSFVGAATLSLTDSSLARNQAVGSSGGGGPGTGSGGAVENDVGIVSIVGCTLSDNVAAAGSGVTHEGDDSSVNCAFGGAIANAFGSQLEISGSALRGNEALGGSGAVHVAPNTADAGGAHGGALFNTFGASATVRDSVIEHNRAAGGSGNIGAGPVAFAGVATGGGIDNSFDGLFAGLGPTALTLVDCTVRHNEAVGGDGNTANSAGADAYAGAGLGGAVANYFGAAADVVGTSLDHNRAAGGRANVANGAATGLGAGGALYNAFGRFQLDTGETLAPSEVRVSRSSLDRNNAEGGGTAGDAFGGGAYNDASASLTFAAISVTGNRALGAGSGRGIGGGVFNLGSFTYDSATLIQGNRASTSNDDLFG